MPVYLVATDLSARGDRAVRRAFALARAHQARLIVASAVDDDLPQALAAELAAGAERTLADVVAADPDRDAVEYETRMLRGDPSLAIATLAATEAVDLLILGAHRVRPVADIFLDTTMLRILRQVTCPVLLVRNPVAHPYRGILAATDFSPASAAALRTAAALVPDASIAAIHAFHVPFKGLMPRETAAPFLAEARSHEAEWRGRERLPERLGPVTFEEGPATEVISEALAATGADLIAVGAHSRAGMAARLLGSFATMLIEAAPTDLIVARPG
ncbi:universal stress protein [Defluviimonas sp. WL0024]|uniref:Universal stress protein n=1 Tax=Albidovulum salinarum TaxID=2984153 RepID=A0ABT2X1A4_9RHOB|nr:universal stress protein [Defluviimonas sp. WL0024]MCU9847104.1 universal stress protein [Defluviimonas sp. WL0024]